MLWIFNKFSVKIAINNQKYLIKRNLTHYEVLNLSNNSTSKQIKESYIKLSKKYHPDKNVDPNSHAKFVQIHEAYNVLSKPETRRNYDLGLVPNNNTTTKSNATYNTVNPWDNPIFWNNRDKTQDEYFRSQPYYGIKGVKKVSNFIIVLICCFITSIGVGLQILAINSSMTLRRDHMLQKSKEAETSLNESKQKALVNGNLYQIEVIKQKVRQNGQNKDID